MSILHSFSTHNWVLGGNTVMLASSDVDSDTARQLSAYIKQDNSLCGYLHVVHQKTTPYVDSGEVRTWFVDGKLVEIKDWLVDDFEGLIHYPYPPLKFWPNNNFYRKLQAEGVQFPYLGSNKVRWRNHNGNLVLLNTPLESPEAKSDILSAALDALNLDRNFGQIHTHRSCVSSHNHATMASTEPNPKLLDAQSTFEQSPQFMDLADHMNVTADGTVDRLIRKRVAVPDNRDTMAVFVHAGAGYHSLQNEHVHLTMCAK